MSRPRTRVAAASVGGWVLVSLVPWWQRRITVSGPGNQDETRVFSANVWHASSAASIALVLMAVLTVVLVLTSGRVVRTGAERLALLAAAWVPVALIGQVALSVWRVAGAAGTGRLVLVGGPYVPPDYHEYHVVRDKLEIRLVPGSWQGPAWGAGLYVVLVLVVAAWATMRSRRRLESPASDSPDPSSSGN
jgi:hypothetical protein